MIHWHYKCRFANSHVVPVTSLDSNFREDITQTHGGKTFDIYILEISQTGLLCESKLILKFQLTSKGQCAPMSQVCRGFVPLQQQCNCGNVHRWEIIGLIGISWHFGKCCSGCDNKVHFPQCLLVSKVKSKKSLSHVLLFATPWTITYQAPPSMGFSR